jgi:hypothetical protein
MFSPLRSKPKKFTNDQIIIREQEALIESLEKKVDSSNPSNFYERTSLNLPVRTGPDKKLYAQDLRVQIEEKSKKAEQNKLKVHFEHDTLCSINLPSTPDYIRREREKEKKLQVKKDLENQIDQKSYFIKNEKMQKIESERRDFNDYLLKLEKEENDKKEVRKKEKEILIQSWKNQIKFKELQEQIGNLENQGFNPRARSVLNIKKELISAGPSLEITQTEQIRIEDNSKKIQMVQPLKKMTYLEKAAHMKTNIDERYKNTFQYKIKKILENVKETRKNKSKSVSPARFVSKKKFDLR